MDIMDFRERSFAKLAVIADKLGCDISGSTDDVDLCMVTHCRNPIGYAVLCGNQWSRISEQEFNKFSKPSSSGVMTGSLMVGAISVVHSISAQPPKVAQTPLTISTKRRLACSRTCWLKVRMVPVK